MSTIKGNRSKYPPARTSSTGTKQILIADDNRDDHLFIVMAAEKAGVPVEFQFVNDGSEVMTHLSRIDSIAELPDVIVLDLRMPRMNGHRTLQLLKADPVYMEIPVVILTTSSSESDKQRSEGLGANIFMTKPSGFWSMVELVQELSDFAVGQTSFKDHLLSAEPSNNRDHDGLSFDDPDEADTTDRWTH